jgi:hypothetical protein
MGRISRAILLFKASWSVLQQEKLLIVIPIFSFVASVLLIASFALPTYQYLNEVSPGFLTDENQDLVLTNSQSLILCATLFGWYVLNFFIVFFFNAVILACAQKLLMGEKTSLGYGFKTALSHVWLIFQWAIISATIGVILKMIEERLGFIGEIIISFIGMAFALVSFMVLPMLIIEGKSPIAALKDSAAILKKTWGESLAGFGGIGILFFFIHLPFLLLLGYGFVTISNSEMQVGMAMIVIALIGLSIFSLLQTTLSTIYKAAIFQYATTGQTTVKFNDELFGSALKIRNAKRRKGILWKR